MGFFRDLFSRAVTAKDLRAKLADVERERNRTQLDMRKLAARQAELVAQIKQMRKDGNMLEVDYLWEDLKTVKAEATMVRREARILNLEGIALKRYVRGLERIERNGDRDSARKLIERIRTSGLDSRLATADVSEKEYLQELQATLDDVGLDSQGLEDLDRSDPEKSKFLEQLDEIIEAENAGDVDKAVAKEAELKAKLDDREAKESERERDG